MFGETFLVVTLGQGGRVLLASSGESPGVPHDAKDSPATRSSLVQMVSGAGVDKLP